MKHNELDYVLMRRVVEFIRVACCVMTPCSLVGLGNVELGKILFLNSGQQIWGMQTVPKL
jgi:hypothetical protein